MLTIAKILREAGVGGSNPMHMDVRVSREGRMPEVTSLPDHISVKFLGIILYSLSLTNVKFEWTLRDLK